MFTKFLQATLAACIIVLGAPAIARDVSDSVAPEFSSGATEKQLSRAKSHMVAAANPLAVQAGLEILNAGGNAIDAMVAVQAVLGLVEPQSSGLGGGAFLVYYDAAAGRLRSFDGRETAPKAARPDMFLDSTGQPMNFFDAVIGGKSVGTPGTVKLLHDVHTELGALPWESVLQPAIKLAREGFEVSPRLNALISRSAETLYKYSATREYFLTEEGVPLPVGTIVRNLPYAETLQAIADGGADRFYNGEIARAIANTVQNAPGNPGYLSVEDLASYETKEREPVCYRYRDLDVCGMGPPSSGALSVGQILGMVEAFELSELGPGNPKSWRIIGDASRLAFADRSKFMADADFVRMPKGLLNRDYLWDRGQFLIRENAMEPEEIEPGNPPFDHAMNFAPDTSIELPSTSHFSIVDKHGNVVSMTTTIENGFGSRLMVNGFLLNNELTDFSFLPEVNGLPVANSIEPGKRPRSSMSPTIIMKAGKPVAALGSPGGSRIIGYVAKTIIALVDWGMNIQQAIELPHLVNRFGSYDVERGTAAEAFVDPLEALGYEVNVRDLNSGLHGIVITDNGLEGGADPRREGIAAGN